MNYIFNITKSDKTSLISETLKLFLKDVNIEYNQSSFQNEINKVLKDTMQLDEESLKTISKEITETIKKVQRDNPNLTQEELVKEAQRQVNLRFDLIYKESRLNAIGRTVVTYTNEKAKKDVSKKLKLKRVWLSERDSKVRDTHLRADGQMENDKGKFKIGRFETDHPAGSGLPAGEVVNCRCVTIGRKVEN